MRATVTRVVPPIIQVMLCGVQYADIYPSGKIKLVYTDGTEESAKPKAYDRNNFFSLVSAVQAERKP